MKPAPPVTRMVMYASTVVKSKVIIAVVFTRFLFCSEQIVQMDYLYGAATNS
jgi:hypothetical protein